MWELLFLLILVGCIYVYFSYKKELNGTYEKLASYHTKSIESEFGEMTYVEEGTGEAILIAHGIFGGYDQGFVSLKKLVGKNFRKISVSRFGYPGSSLPENPSPTNQAKVFKELIDTLGVEQVYILGTSAGGASALQFALRYPEKTKGLILLSSGAPDKQRTLDEI